MLIYVKLCLWKWKIFLLIIEMLSRDEHSGLKKHLVWYFTLTHSRYLGHFNKLRLLVQHQHTNFKTCVVFIISFKVHRTNEQFKTTWTLSWYQVKTHNLRRKDKVPKHILKNTYTRCNLCFNYKLLTNNF